MAIISRIGRKNWRVRLLFAGMYTFLIIGGATMVYPFMLMLSGSTKSAMDIKFFDAYPRFLYDDNWMWAKHAEGLFNEQVPYLNMVYDADEVTFEDLAKRFNLETETEVRCPKCETWFQYEFGDCQKLTAEPKLLHEHQASCPKCQQTIAVPHGAPKGSLAYSLLHEPNEKLVQVWEKFIPAWEESVREREEQGYRPGFNDNHNWLTSYAYSPGYIHAPVSRTFTSGQRGLKKFLPIHSQAIDTDPEEVKKLKKYSDIGVVNKINGTDFLSWNTVNMIPAYNVNRRASPMVSVYANSLSEFFDTIPLGMRYYFTIDGYYKKDFLKPVYSQSLQAYNEANQTNYTSWNEIFVTRRYPAEAVEKTKADWEEFVRKSLAMEWIKIDESVAPLYREMLSFKHTNIENFNKRYGGLQYKSFEEVPFPTTAPPCGMARSDWQSLLVGYFEPSNNKLYIAPVETLEICGLDFAFQDWILEEYGSLEKAAAALGTDWQKITDVRLPQLDVHRCYFRENIKDLRWEFVTRNYKAVADYMLFHGRGIINTVIYCSLAILTALLVNPLAAYAMSRYKMPSSYKILLFLMCTMAFPAMVTAIPSFIMLRTFGLLNTFAALILPGMANGYSIFLLKGFFDAQPQELYESAQLDGATEWVLFWQITMSLSKPILAVIALGAFTAAYSNFMFAFVTCQDQKMWTMMVWLYQLQQSSGQAVMYASLVIAAIPTFIIFLFCQNIIMRGIVVPSEK